MKPVQASLKKWMNENKNFKEKHLEMKREVLNDPKVKTFLAANPSLSQDTIEKNLIQLYEYKTQSKQCSNCSGLNDCTNILQGYSPVLEVVQGEIHLSYEKCKSRINYENKKEQQDLIQSLYMPKDTMEARISKIHEDPDRSDAIRQTYRFVKMAKEELPAKGLYLHGSFGVGKTYFLGAIANQLKEYNISSTLIYMPEFVREIRDSFKDDSVNDKVNYFKKANVLMLDDIGSETQSAWFRDEVLGSILQYRMMERLPVFFTSNYTLEELEEQLRKTTKGGYEKLKAGRIMERIRQVSNPVTLEGDNRRRF